MGHPAREKKRKINHRGHGVTQSKAHGGRLGWLGCREKQARSPRTQDPVLFESASNPEREIGYFGARCVFVMRSCQESWSSSRKLQAYPRPREAKERTDASTRQRRRFLGAGVPSKRVILKCAARRPGVVPQKIRKAN